MRWGDSITLQFVKIYLSKDCLWNPENPGYKLKYQRDNAYKEIVEEFQEVTSKLLSVPEVKIKIKNLRTTYYQQYQKILKHSKPNACYEPTLSWFKEMDNCLKNVPSRQLYNSSYQSPQESNQVDSSCQIWVDQPVQNDAAEEMKPDPLSSQTDEEYETLLPEDQIIHTEEHHNTPKIYKKIKRKKLKQRISSQESTYSNGEFVNLNEDEFDVYGKYIATQLRHMNLTSALRLQLQIQTLICETRISDMS